MHHGRIMFLCVATRSRQQPRQEMEFGEKKDLARACTATSLLDTSCLREEQGKEIAGRIGILHVSAHLIAFSHASSTLSISDISSTNPLVYLKEAWKLQ